MLPSLPRPVWSPFRSLLVDFARGFGGIILGYIIGLAIFSSLSAVVSHLAIFVGVFVGAFLVCPALFAAVLLARWSRERAIPLARLLGAIGGWSSFILVMPFVTYWLAVTLRGANLSTLVLLFLFPIVALAAALVASGMRIGDFIASKSRTLAGR